MTSERSTNRPDLLELGSEMTGSAFGAVGGLFLGGAEGAVAGAVLGPAAAEGLRWAIQEVGDRLLGRRGQQRAMGAALYAGQRLEQLRGAGAELRTDGFFDVSGHSPSSAQELAEGVMLAAVSSFEERKVAHIGYLYANIAVDVGIDRALASVALRRAQELSWRQYVLLALASSKDSIEPPHGGLSGNPGSWARWGVFREVQELLGSGVVHAGSKQTANLRLTYPGDDFADLELGREGILLHHLLSLDLVPRDEVVAVRDLLDRGPLSDGVDS